MTTGYQTVKDSSAVREPSHQQQSPVNTAVRDSTSRVSMPRTRNKYRLRAHKASECDDMLFGKPVSGENNKEWKAPWDSSRTKTPLLFDSTDRTGHYSPEKHDIQLGRESHSAKANHQRAWR